MKNNCIKLPIFPLAAVLLLLAAISCSDDDVDPPIIPNLSINALSTTLVVKDTFQLKVGDTLRLSATVEPTNSFGQQVAWSSSEINIAEVDTEGLITGIAPGTTTITATSLEIPELTASIRLTVSNPNTILAFSIAGLQAVQPVITDSTVVFKIDFNTEGKALDVAELTTTVIHNGTSVSTPEGTIIETTDFTATIVQDFRSEAKAYIVTGEDEEERTYQVSVQTKPGTEFITTWNEANITIPTNLDFTYSYNIDIDNDGFIDQTGITGNVPVTFEGERTLRISGQFPAIRFSSSSLDERNTIQSLEQWGTVQWESMRSAFFGCDSLQAPATDVPDLSRVTNMSGMFRDADKVNPDVSRWNTSNVTTMLGLFASTDSANPDVSNWDTGKVISMSNLFSFARNANPNVSSWNTSNVTTMLSMFLGAESANPDVSNWDTSKVNNMRSMFNLARSATPDVSQWDTSKVTRMENMFNQATSATPDVSEWDTSQVTDMANMFARAENAEPDVSNWETGRVTNMFAMFAGATKANPDLSQWNISSLRAGTPAGMFNIFEGTSLSRENYEKALIRFAEHAEPDNDLTLRRRILLGTVPVTFCSEEAAQAKIVLENNSWRGIGEKGDDCDFNP